MIEGINELKSGAVLSESSHYIVKDILGSSVRLTHYESNSEVTIDLNYLKKYTNSADLFIRTEKVTKEDKRDGTLGIRSIWENIHCGQVFTVCFKKQDKPKTKKRLNELLAQNTGKPIEQIEKDTDRDNYMTAQEALAYGIIDSVVEKRA